ncbi:hypothetical protein B4153_1589 [Bacillus cereus]|uniref:Uncharacterized protein n=1 Tax=Bacillus cereus (strain AH187) TaxID=405534 RepID=B7HL37_BACC7|nr:hypothetical protein BCAH187_A1690 [Bacillus cereus AH187]KKZ90678.1 hypothetical protein B4153_1589 [Bacillus cereus]KLA09945.1 hypothetical protein B4078_1460 [Bacillus cereus]
MIGVPFSGVTSICSQLFILMIESLLYNRVEFDERMKGVGHTAWFTCMQC